MDMAKTLDALYLGKEAFGEDVQQRGFACSRSIVSQRCSDEGIQAQRTASTVAAYNDLPLNLLSKAQCKHVGTGHHGRRREGRTTRLRPRPTEDAPQDGIVGENGARGKRIRRV